MRERAVIVCVCVCVLGREGSWVFAGTALVLVVVWMAMCLTSYTDYLTGFHEPFLPPYRCHTSFKMSSVFTEGVTRNKQTK